jgi:hypothetical protein
MSTSWKIIYNLAKDAGAKYPEVVSAQWALESGFGERVSGKHNYFGLKGTSGTVRTTQEWVNGRFIIVQDTFKDFSSPKESVEYLVSRWYKDFKGHRGVNRASSREECAELLRVEGFATDPRYTKKLIALINRYQPMSDVSSNNRPAKGFMRNAAVYYRSLPHQNTAWDNLEANLTDEQLIKFSTEYRTGPTVSRPKSPLLVPYQYQRDSRTGHGERMCFSSAMAMAIQYLCPSCLQGDDDDYLRVVLRYGDTVSSEAQLKAARSLGMNVDFRTNLGEKDLIKQLDDSIPVPVGVLHRGPLSSPSGGGHWLTLIGYTENTFICHDPYGRMDIRNGGYLDTGPVAGRSVSYPRDALLRRWLISSPSDGWGMIFRRTP